MKLLYILPEYLPESGGGIISHYAPLLPELVRLGHDVTVMVCNHGQLDCSELTLEGVRVTYLESRYHEQAREGCFRFRKLPVLWAFLPLAWGAFLQSRGGEGYDIVEATDWMLLMAPWVVAGRVPAVVSLHGSCGQVNWHESAGTPNLEDDILRQVEIGLIREAEAVTANSRANAAFWREQSGRDIAVIPPAFPSGERAAVDVGVLKGRSKRGLVVGRLQNWKGAELLCRALEESPQIEVDWIGRDTEWMGTGRMASAFLAENYQDVFGQRLHLHPPVPHQQVLERMAEADFVCVPSTWDVFNLTAAEAMAQGAVVVCSSAAGAEMLIEDGVNGFIFDSEGRDGARGIAEALRLASALPPDEARRIGQVAMETVDRQMAPERVAGDCLERYREAIAAERNDGTCWLSNLVALDRSESVALPERRGWRGRIQQLLGKL